jgi:negative regulator of sigma E activity
MIAKAAVFAAAVCASTVAVAQPNTSRAGASSSVRSTAGPSIALGKIIGRVHLDLLIDEIVSPDSVKPAERRGVALASVDTTKVRNRS